jgi:hypothetical protein
MTAEQQASAEMVAKTAITVAAAFFPAGPLIAGGVIKLYDALMAVKPKEVTVEEWRELLQSPAVTKTADEYVNEARAAAATT